MEGDLKKLLIYIERGKKDLKEESENNSYLKELLIKQDADSDETNTKLRN